MESDELDKRKDPHDAPQQDVLSTANLGFLLAKALERWNEVLTTAFHQRGYGHVKASHGSVLIPLFEEEGLRMGDLASRARIKKQTLTTLIRSMEQADLVERRTDPLDGRSYQVFLTSHSREFKKVARDILSAMRDDIEDIVGPNKTEVLRESLIRLQELPQLSST